MLALVFVERHALACDPRVRFKKGGLFARAEMQFGRETAAAQKEVQRRGLFQTIGAEKKMTSRRGMQAREALGFRQRAGIRGGGRTGGGEPALEKAFPTAETGDA